MDLIDYFSKPESERVLSDLLIDLGFNVATAVLSGIAGTVAAGLGIMAAGFFGFPVIVAVGIGFGLAVVVGLAISAALDATSIKDNLKEAAHNADLPSNLQPYVYQSIREGF